MDWAELLPPDAEPFRALYLHVPFCARRCLYCDFATRAVASSDPAIAAYAEQMVLDIRRAAKQGLLGEIETVYVGGGTPSFVPQVLTQILYTLGLSMHLTVGVECTVEANPDSLDDRLVRDLWALGANRISIGVQSFDDAELRALGRIHNADAARRAVAAAQTRFDNVSVDLMCGIPGQTLDSFRTSVEESLALGVAHVSVYPLTVEDGTPLQARVQSGELPDADPDFQADCMELAAEVLEGAGLVRYEVASHARPGYECRHNIAYWTGVPYLGLGPSAVTMAQNAAERVRLRDGLVEERLDATEALAEDLMLALRMTRGAGSGLVEQARATFPNADATFSDLCARGLARWTGECLTPTNRGWLCGNELYAALLDLNT